VAGAEPAARTNWLIPCTCRRRGRVTPAANHPHPGCQMTPTPQPWGKTGCHRLGQPAPERRHKRESSIRPRLGTPRSYRASTARQAAGGPSGNNSSLEETQARARVRSGRRGASGGSRGGSGGPARPPGKKHSAKHRIRGGTPGGRQVLCRSFRFCDVRRLAWSDARLIRHLVPRSVHPDVSSWRLSRLTQRVPFV